MSDGLLDEHHVCTEACAAARIASGLVYPLDASMHYFDRSPHMDCEHVEFDLLENCRMCGRHRSLCEAA